MSLWSVKLWNVPCSITLSFLTCAFQASLDVQCNCIQSCLRWQWPLLHSCKFPSLTGKLKLLGFDLRYLLGGWWLVLWVWGWSVYWPKCLLFCLCVMTWWHVSNATEGGQVLCFEESNFYGSGILISYLNI